MNKPLDQVLSEAAENTFETLVFMCPVPPEETPAPDAAPAALVAVEFDGPFSGQLVVGVSKGMMPAMASNMLGLAPDVTPSLDRQHDALKELANVICGNLLPMIAGPKAVFNVHAPVIVAEEPTLAGARAGAATITLDTGVAHLALYVRGEMPVAVET